tara:strand:- start:258 stop:1001 length:744 start_codon:yes stop_codon:yes gene_type:complete
MAKHIDKILGAVNKRKGLAHPNRFSITFPALQEVLTQDQARDFEFFCESTSMPGRQILTTDYGPTRQAIKRPNGYSNEDINFVFNLTNDYFIRDVFTRWTNEIIDRDTYEVGYRDDYSMDIEIHQLDEQDNKVYTSILRDAFPVTVQNIDLNNTTESSVQKLNVTMSYRDFEEDLGISVDLGSKAFDARLPERVKQNREPSGGPLPNRADVVQKRRRIPTIIPFLPPKINQINRIARIFGVTATQPQ